MSLTKVAVMQPYFFPYIGYFQLINSVDTFVVYDDVNFIKNGWINRNRILNGKNSLYINLVLNQASPNKKINQIKLSENNIWKVKLLKQIKQNYSKAPFFEEVFKVLEQTINFENLEASKYLVNSIYNVCTYLGISTKIIPSSAIYNNSYLNRSERLFDICKQENADIYINPLGGDKLYTKEEFANENIDLQFLKTNNIIYQQYKNEMLPNLSIIDVLMFNSQEEITQMLNQYTLV